MTPPLAHAGHWTGLIYAAPVAIVGVLMAVDAWRQRRRDKGDDRADDSPPES